MINLKSLNTAVSFLGEYKIYVISATALIALVSSLCVKCNNDRTNTLLGKSTGEIVRSKDTIDQIRKARESLKVPTKKQVTKQNIGKNNKGQDNDAAHF